MSIIWHFNSENYPIQFSENKLIIFKRTAKKPIKNNLSVSSPFNSQTDLYEILLPGTPFFNRCN